MSRSQVVVVSTGCANIASVMAAFSRFGVVAEVASEPQRILDAQAVVLPGVGHFEAGIRCLRRGGLDQSLLQRIELGRPLLAICLGMQLLCDASDEAPGERGLGVIPGRVSRFDNQLRIPQMGWNRIAPVNAPECFESGDVYFANSYRLAETPPGWSAAIAEYGEPFVAGLERGGLLACQFHPELSGRFGLELLKRWLLKSQVMENAPC